MRSGKYQLLMALVLSGAILSCVKDPQDIPSGIMADPVFRMRAILGNEPMAIDAGRDGWTMLPLAVQEDSLVAYTSVFSQDGCLDQCSPSWTFRFYQHSALDSDPATAFQNTVTEGPKELVISDLQRDSFTIQINTHPALFMSGYSYWQDLNDLTNTFFHEYENVIGYQEQLNVCFQSLAYTGCQYTQCIYFDPATLIPCLSFIEPILENARHVSLNVHPQGTPPFHIEWFNGSNASGIVIPIQDTLSEIYAGVTVTDALGNRSELNQSIRVQNGIVDACYFPIELTSTPVENLSADTYEDRVEIIYRDSAGVEWRSTAGIQSAPSSVFIHQVIPYGTSPMGQPTYQVEVSMNAQLFNALTGESRSFSMEKATLALSHF